MWTCALVLECINVCCHVTLLFDARAWFNKKMLSISCIWSGQFVLNQTWRIKVFCQSNMSPALDFSWTQCSYKKYWPSKTQILLAFSWPYFKVKLLINFHLLYDHRSDNRCIKQCHFKQKGRTHVSDQSKRLKLGCFNYYS